MKNVTKKHMLKDEKLSATFILEPVYVIFFQPGETWQEGRKEKGERRKPWASYSNEFIKEEPVNILRRF